MADALVHDSFEALGAQVEAMRVQRNCPEDNVESPRQRAQTMGALPRSRDERVDDRWQGLPEARRASLMAQMAASHLGKTPPRLPAFVASAGPERMRIDTQSSTGTDLCTPTADVSEKRWRLETAFIDAAVDGIYDGVSESPDEAASDVEADAPNPQRIDVEAPLPHQQLARHRPSVVEIFDLTIGGGFEAEPVEDAAFDAPGAEAPESDSPPPVVQIFDLARHDDPEPIGGPALEVLEAGGRQDLRSPSSPRMGSGQIFGASSSSSSTVEAAMPSGGNEWRRLEEELSRAQERARELLQGRSAGASRTLKERRAPHFATAPCRLEVGDAGAVAASSSTAGPSGEKERGDGAEDTEGNDKELRVSGGRRCFDVLVSELEAGLGGKPANVISFSEQSPQWMQSSDRPMTMMVRKLAEYPTVRLCFFIHVLLLQLWAGVFFYRHVAGWGIL